MLYSIVLAIVLPITWTKTEGKPWTYLDESSSERIIHYTRNDSIVDITEPAWTADCYFSQDVTGSNPTPGPSWGAKFATLSNTPLGIGYSGGGITVPSGSELQHYVPVALEEGKESWTADASPFAASRNRNWMAPGTKLTRIITPEEEGEEGGEEGEG